MAVNPDDALFVKFYVRKVPDAVLSKEKGYEVSKDEDWIEIRFDDDRTVVDVPVRPSDIERFSRQYEAFKRKASEQFVGVPLSKIFAYSPARVEHYERHSIYSVEQLAASSDTTLQSLGMGAVEDRRKCQKYLEDAKASFNSEAHQKEMDALKEQIEEEKERSKNIEAQLQAFLDAQSKDKKLVFKEK